MSHVLPCGVLPCGVLPHRMPTPRTLHPEAQCASDTWWWRLLTPRTAQPVTHFHAKRWLTPRLSSSRTAGNADGGRTQLKNSSI